MQVPHDGGSACAIRFIAGSLNALAQLVRKFSITVPTLSKDFLSSRARKPVINTSGDRHSQPNGAGAAPHRAVWGRETLDDALFGLVPKQRARGGTRRFTRSGRRYVDRECCASATQRRGAAPPNAESGSRSQGISKGAPSYRCARVVAIVDRADLTNLA